MPCVRPDLGACAPSERAATPGVIRGQVVSDASLDRAELARPRDDNAKLRAKLGVLTDMLNGPVVRP